MGVLINGQKPRAVMAVGNKLKKIMCRGQQIWSGSVKITFVEAGSWTTVEWEEGTTVNRATAPSDATFVGWSTSPSGANPVRTFTASADIGDITVYRVVKANTLSPTCMAYSPGLTFNETAFNISSSKHSLVGTYSYDGSVSTAPGHDDYSLNAWFNGKLLDYGKGKGSGSVTAKEGVNTLKCEHDGYSGSVTLTLSFQGKTYVG